MFLMSISINILSKKLENGFSIFVLNLKTSLLLSPKKSSPSRSVSSNPSSNSSIELLSQQKSVPVDSIKRYNTDDRIKLNELKQLFLSRHYQKVPTTFNQELLSEQLKYFMINKNFFLAKFEGFSFIDTEGHFFPTFLTERPVNGPLISLFKQVKNITEEKKIAIICGITCAIFGIHKKGFVHSNLNATTVYLNEKDFPIICHLNLFKREVFTVSGFNHPVIIKYIGYSPYSLIKKLENSKDANIIKPTLIMEYKVNGNLEDAIASGKLKNDQTTKLKIIIGIASGINALHKNNVVHRDLNKNNEPAIIDFGCSRQYSVMIDNRMTNRIGTCVYMAPVLFDAQLNHIYTYHVDIYSFGITVNTSRLNKLR